MGMLIYTQYFGYNYKSRFYGEYMSAKFLEESFFNTSG